MILTYDTETTGLDRRRDKMFAFSTCTEQGKAVASRLDGNPVRVVKNKYELKRIWQDISIVKIMHNAKFDLGFTKEYLGISLQDLAKHPIHDTSLMSRVLQNEHRTHALKDLTYELFGYPRDDETRAKKYLTTTSNMQDCPEEVFNEYQTRDAIRTMLLYKKFLPDIACVQNYEEIYQSELDVIIPTMSMEDRGVMINRSACQKLIDKLHADIKDVAGKIAYELGQNVRPGQEAYRFVFFKYLNIPLKKVPKTPSGLPLLKKEEILNKYRITHPCPLIEWHLMYSSWVHGVAIIESYLELADKNDILHPNINTCQAVTARQSSDNPNLQNVSKEKVLLNPYPVNSRGCFRPKPDHVNFHLDYSGIEMRLLIHYAGDKELVDIANTPGGDVHLPATLIFFPEYPTCDPKRQKELRNAAKNCNFAKPYGAEVEKMADTLNLSLSETLKKNAEYELRFPNLSSLNKQVAREVRECGITWTTFGRRLAVEKEFAYIGLNYKIQGTAAEMLKRAEPKVYQCLEESTSGEMGMIMPIHDELIIECPRKRLKDAKSVLQEVARRMVSFPGKFKVPFEVEVDVAPYDWSRKLKYSLK